MLAKIGSIVVSAIASISGIFGAHTLATIPTTSQAAGTAFALPSGVTDTVTVTNASGAAQANYPYQFGRPFVQGEIARYPQVLVNGTAVPTQADIKNKYPDGSVKFAVISVIIPNIPASGAVTLSFQDQAPGNNTPLSTSQMFGANFNFDATINLTQAGVTKTADARTMVGNGDYTYWASGPIATTIVIQDNSVARKYDLGFDALRSIHPQFEATFWPTLNKVYVRVSGMDWNSTALEDVKADLAITTGNSSPQTVYTNPGLVMVAASGWTKEFWLGGAPAQQINIDDNIAYLAATKFIPNYDPSLKSIENEATIANRYSQWTSPKHPNDLYQAGGWTVYMPTTGARGDIGIEPSWMANWLYTGDWRDRTVALGQADLATSWSWNVVEGDPSYKIDRAQTISGLGLPVSDYGHPTEWLFDSRGASKIKVQGTRITPPVVWGAETAHHPDPFSVPYILTGDPFYLGELQNWAGATALKYAICDKSGPNCGSIRTATPAIAGIADQVRGNAWVLRTRASAGFLSVDGTPQQQYFTDITDDALAEWVGQRAIPDPVLSNTPGYIKAAKDFAISSISPLHFFGPGVLDRDGGLTVHGTATEAESMWQDYYFMSVLGYVKDMGYPAGSLLTWMSKSITEQFNDMPPNGHYDIGLLALYRTPASEGRGQPWFNNFDQVEAELLPATITNVLAQANGGNYYMKEAGAAAAAVANEAGGAKAWNWFVSTNLRGTPSSQKNFVGDANTNFIPRSVTDIPLPPPNTTPIPTVPVTPPATTTPPTKPATTTPPVVTPPATTTPPVATAPLKNLAVSGDFTQTSTCTSATVKSPCTVSVVFKPTLAGARTGAFTFSDGVTGKSYSIALSGTGVAPVTPPPATTTPPVVTPPITPVSSTLTGTDGNDTLTLTPDIHTVDGKGGNDVAVLSFVGTASVPSWYKIVQNADGSYTAADVHASGYKVTLYNVEQLKWPAGYTVNLGSATIGNTVPPENPNPHNADILGTDGNDTLTVTGTGHVVDGKGGYDIAVLNWGNSGIASDWFRFTKNADGSITAKDVHGTGQSVTLWNVEELKFPHGSDTVLANAKFSLGFFDSLVAFFQDTKLNIQLAFQGAGRNLAILLSGGNRNLATATIAVSVPSLSFGSVMLGQTASQVLTISFNSSGITAIATSTK